MENNNKPGNCMSEMKKNGGKYYPNVDSLSNNYNVVSSTECTGLVQVYPDKEEEVEAYQDIYDIPEQGGLNVVEKEVAKEAE